MLLLVLSFIGTHAQHTSRQDFTSNWKFRLDSTGSYHHNGVDDAQWRTLNLPHDWSIEGTFSKDHPATAGGGALPGGTGWYRKHFNLPATDKGKTILIHFDGIYKNAEVWVNGNYVGKRPNGYISFHYDITPHLVYGGANVVAVKVDNLKQPNSRWYSGSGIYRNVWLTKLDKLHVEQWGTFVTTPKVSNQSATVSIETNVRNQYAFNKAFVLNTTIYKATGGVAARASTKANAGSKITAAHKQVLEIKQPHLWSVDNPYLYKVVSQVVVNGKVVDTYETPLGIRYFHFSPTKGFSLNGNSLKIRGVCNHHDLGALGAAINTRALERQLELLKAMGCNGIRTAHNPPAPELLELCDKMGFIVMNETFDMWEKQKSPFDYHLDWHEWHKQDLTDHVLRDRNHPSVFVWSVGNEIGEQWGDEKKADTSGRRIARALVSIVKSIDTTREIVTANNETGEWNQLIRSGAFEMIGYNYHHDEWAKVPERYPGKTFIVTESTSALQTRGHYDHLPFDSIRRWPKRWDIAFTHPEGAYTVSAYDNVSTPWGSTHEESLKALKQPHVSGMYIWTGFDYLGEPTPYSWPARSSYFGIIDLAGFPKDVYYLYQSEWTSKPVLHIYPHWTWKQGDTVDVVAYYNNADEVELLLNGKSLGKRAKTGDNLHVKWRVLYEPGKLEAISRLNEREVLRKEIKTAGKPARVNLKADRNTIAADGKDLSFVTATIVDKDGVMVPTANHLIKFKVDGAAFIAGVDSGDPVSHEPFKADKHTALNGLALAILQSTGAKGKATLTASVEGLESSTITIQTR